MNSYFSMTNAELRDSDDPEAAAELERRKNKRTTQLPANSMRSRRNPSRMRTGDGSRYMIVLDEKELTPGQKINRDAFVSEMKSLQNAFSGGADPTRNRETFERVLSYLTGYSYWEGAIFGGKDIGYVEMMREHAKYNELDPDSIIRRLSQSIYGRKR